MTAFCLPKHISPAQFLDEYWQKKPLLIKNGLPALKDLFCPDDILALATQDEVSARLITQQGQHWTLKNSPLDEQDFENLPPLWTVLVQNLEAWSGELGQLWQAFDFIPRWQQDDIMVSYAPKGGSVGKHYDDYDVFLAQGFGARRWQLGKMCDNNTSFVKGEPIRLLDDMGQIIFDEVLHAGDVLYVPPKLSHYGVAQDDCLTFSFGFRRPNMVQLLDKIADVATSQKAFFVPLSFHQNPQDNANLLTQSSIDDIKSELILAINSPQFDQVFTSAICELVSRRQYEPLAFFDELTADELHTLLTNGASLSINHASRFVCHNNAWYVNGEKVEFDKQALDLLTFFADGGVLDIKTLPAFNINTDDLAFWVNNHWLSINDCDFDSDNFDDDFDNDSDD